MSRIFKGICWTVPILLVALGNRLLLIDDNTAQTLFVVLPIVALMALRGETACWIGKWRLPA